MGTSPLERAIELAGSEAKLGAGIGFSQVAINKAKRRGGSVSAEMALKIDHFLHGGVSASELRPDLWNSPRDVPAPAREKAASA